MCRYVSLEVKGGRPSHLAFKISRRGSMYCRPYRAATANPTPRPKLVNAAPLMPASLNLTQALSFVSSSNPALCPCDPVSMGSTVAGRVLLLLLCLAVGDAVRHDVEGAAREYEKQEHERIEHEHVQEGTAAEVAGSEPEWGSSSSSDYSCTSTSTCKSIGPYCYCSNRKCHC